MDRRIQTVQIPIGERVEEVRVPNLVRVAEPRYIPGVPDPREEVRRAVLSPIGSRPLREIAAGRKRAVIVVNDITRPYPGRLMAEEILRELNAAGMRDEQAALLIAYGQHRENTREELESIYGHELLRRLKVVHHHAGIPEENRTIGVTRGGVPVSVNRFYLDADLKILTGCIAPHQFAGFSGGRKSVIPGIADIAAVKRHHSFPIRPEKISLGMLEGNRFHLEALEAARMTGVDFIVNSVDNAQREMVACVAGDLEEAFYAGVGISRKVWTAEIPVRPKIVIVSPGGYPRDFDLHQSQKAIGCSELLLPEGGGLILCAECRDGAGKPGELLRRANSPDEVIDDFLTNGLKPNGNGKAYMLARAAKRYYIALAGSRIPQSDLREMFLDGYDTVEEAIRVMLKRFGPDAPILAVPHASEIIPVFTDTGRKNMNTSHENVNALLRDIPLPRMYRVRQVFDTERVADPAAALRRELERPEIRETVKKGMRIAVTAGSRGIDNIVLILRETVAFLKETGAEPFIIPAMGSHGGATADGQVAILRSLGITEESVGCPIRATMEVKVLTHLQDGTPVHMDRYAMEADGVVVVNRVKPHTGFRGRYESGLFKMMTVGLGKQKGAEMTHGRGRLKMGETIEMCGNAYLGHANILFGVATVENSFDKTWKLAALTREEIREKEPGLLEEARRLLPSLYLQYADVLVVDRMGKNISGTGMDTNITRSYTHGYGISREGRAKRIAALDLTEESHGSAVGIGQADVTTQRLFEKIDFNTTYPNLLTSGGTDSAKIPMILDNQKLAIQAAIKTSAGGQAENVKLIRIPDTLHITEIEVSEGFIDEARNTPGMEILEGPYEWQFDGEGNLF